MSITTRQLLGRVLLEKNDTKNKILMMMNKVMGKNLARIKTVLLDGKGPTHPDSPVDQAPTDVEVSTS